MGSLCDGGKLDRLLDDDAEVYRNFEVLQPRKGPDGRQLPAVLILGGSTFMGRETVEACLGLPARVCVVNRGRSYWGTDDPSQGRAARVKADRRDAQLFAARVDVATERLGGERWAAVADFSAYTGADVRASLSGLRGRFETYAYISSDSVYEVSSWAGGGWERPSSAPPIVTEAASTRPEDEKVRKRLRHADNYGDGKLRAEEALAAGLAKDKLAGRGVCLRLPDVIGPFDDTNRLMAFWHWLHAGSKHPPQVHEPPKKRSRKDDDRGLPAAADVPLAMVFSRDVARFVAHLAAPPAGLPEPPRFDAVNLACEKQPPLREFLQLLAAASGLREPSFAAVSKPKTFLPSVDRPWPLSCEHMRRHYGFKATPLESVLKTTAGWFAEACTKYPSEALAAAKKLPSGPREAAIARARLSAQDASSSDESSS